MQSRNVREGSYQGRTPAAEGGAGRRHVRSRAGAGRPPVSTGASLALLRRLIRRPPL